jgi:hypothetical protein
MIIIKRVLKKQDERVWTGLIWIRIGTGGRFLSTWQRTFEFHKMLGIWVA